MLRAKKHAKMKKNQNQNQNQVESAEKLQAMAEGQSTICEEEDGGRSEMEKSNQVNLISYLLTSEHE